MYNYINENIWGLSLGYGVGAPLVKFSTRREDWVTDSHLGQGIEALMERHLCYVRILLLTETKSRHDL